MISPVSTTTNGFPGDLSGCLRIPTQEDAGATAAREYSRRCVRRRSDVARGGCRLIALFRRVVPAPGPAHDFTPHAHPRLKLLADGQNYKTAAVELDVSLYTISFQLRRIYERLPGHSKSQARGESAAQPDYRVTRPTRTTKLHT